MLLTVLVLFARLINEDPDRMLKSNKEIRAYLRQNPDVLGV